MKKSILYLGLLFAFFVSATTVKAQNLVVNPSFENTSGCATIPIIGGSTEGFSDLQDWDNANSNTPGDSCSSPDLFSTCNQMPFGGAFPMDFFTGVPGNVLGYQCPKTGDKYAGIITNEMGAGLGQSYREYIQGKLSSPLQAGQTYCVSFYISLGDNVTFATNNIGVYFSNTHYLRDACAQGSLINETPQLNYDCNVVTDTNQWIRLQWNYVATGGESYFMIGNFFNDANTNIQGTGVTSMNPYAYYYIDDVSIVPGACNYAEIITTDANGCGGQSNPSDPALIFCTGDPATNLKAQEGTTCPPTTPAGTWSGPGITDASTGTFDPNTAGVGTHTITYTAQSGAVATTTILVSDCDPISVCQETDGSLTASGGTAPFTWQEETTTQDCSSCMIGCAMPPGCAVNATVWADFATGANIPAPATYPIKVIDATGTSLDILNASSIQACSNDPCPTITVSVSNKADVTCFGGSDGTATVSASGGTASYTYSWSPGGLTGAVQSSLTQGSYTVTATDNNNCTGTVTVSITEPASFTATVTVDQNEDCGLQNGQLTANPQGGTSPYNYAWSNGSTTQINSNLAAGSYSVTVTDVNNCSTTATGTIVNNSTFTTQTQATQPTCLNPLGDAVVTPNGGQSPFTFAWSNGGNTANISGLTPGTYTVTVTDSSGCSVNDTVAIIANTQQPTISISGTTSICGGQTTTLTASGGSTYTWSTGENNSAITVSPDSTTVYSVTGTDANGCSGTDSVTVNILTSQDLLINVDTTLGCSPLTVTFSSSIPNADTYTWNFGDGQTSASDSPTHTYYGDSCFAVSLTVSYANGCSFATTLDSLICVNPSPTAVFTASPQEITNIVTEVVFSNQSQGATTYTWNFGDTQTSTEENPIHSYNPDVIRNYTVLLVAENELGCTDTTQVTIRMVEDIIFYVPNTFTPDGDEFNNVFKPIIAEGFDAFDYELLIFNRWGELIFETHNSKIGWDGTYLGKMSPDGTYTWQVTIKKTKVDDKVTQIGHVTLLR